MKSGKSNKNSTSGSYTRRKFINITSASVGGMLIQATSSDSFANQLLVNEEVKGVNNQTVTSLIGGYGSWAAGLLKGDLPSLSFRRKEWSEIEPWRKTAVKRAE